MFKFHFGIMVILQHKPRFYKSCADPESFFRVGPTWTTVLFLVNEKREDPNTTISGPSPARQRNAI